LNPDLYARNTPERFWRVLNDPAPSRGEWEEAARRAVSVLPPAVRGHADDMPSLLAMTLGEGQFGPGHWEGGTAQRLYYAVKPAIPRALTLGLRRLYGDRRAGMLQLGWPIEPRYAAFQLGVMGHLLRITGQAHLPFLNFWPDGRRYALVLTHDIESAAGQRFVPEVAALEEDLGFRSSFNFVPELYPLDRDLMADLKTRGFEVGVHGLRHDGKLFSGREHFMRRSARINAYLGEFEAVGFRAPLTQRQPEWMQALEIEYDSSFFDTDPFEPIAGGTMSIWPFQLGRFVELPYTLAQDYTVTAVLNETTPRLWLRKVGFIAANRGMALLDTHPDSLRNPVPSNVYEGFLREMSLRADYHHALPRDVARWWRARAGAALAGDLEGGIASTIHVRDGRVEFSDRRAASPPDRHASRTAGARSSAGRTA